jgi:1-acyl-sn-glycerol-3-phosphate acyltransferase
MGPLLVAAFAGVFLSWKWLRSGEAFKYYFGFRLAWLYARLWHRFWSNRSDPVPVRGPVILVCNHTSSADAAIVQAACNRPIGWMTSREHYECHPLIRGVLDDLQCVPVRRHGKDAMAARSALRHLQKGRVLGVFPEGNLSGVAKKRPISPKAGAAWMALRSGAPLVPAWISGGPQRKEILSAWLFPSRRGARVVFGKPVDSSPFKTKPIKRQLVEQLSMQVMKEIQALKQPSTGMRCQDAGQ